MFKCIAILIIGGVTALVASTFQSWPLPLMWNAMIALWVVNIFSCFAFFFTTSMDDTNGTPGMGAVMFSLPIAFIIISIPATVLVPDVCLRSVVIALSIPTPAIAIIFLAIDIHDDLVN